MDKFLESLPLRKEIGGHRGGPLPAAGNRNHSLSPPLQLRREGRTEEAGATEEKIPTLHAGLAPYEQ